MKFFANENIPVASVKKLRQAGFDVVSVFEECPGETDIKIFLIPLNSLLLNLNSAEQLMDREIRANYTCV